MNRSLSLLASVLLLGCAARASVSETFSQSIPVAPSVAVELSNVNGSIEITAWDKPEVSIEAEKKAKNESDLRELKIEIDAKPDHVVINTRYPHRIFGSSGSVRYTLHVPAGASLRKVSSVNSQINVVGLKGSINLSTVNGGIDARGASADANLHTVNGSIELSVASFAKGARIEMRSVNGSCRLAVPADTSARVDASTVNGHVRCELPITISDSGRRSLHGTIGSGDGRIHAESVNGSIEIDKH